jgi:hypothetical protein
MPSGTFVRGVLNTLSTYFTVKVKGSLFANHLKNFDRDIIIPEAADFFLC